MSKKLYLNGTISVGLKEKSISIGAGTDITSIDWPDKKYGLKDADLERMLGNGTASFEAGAESPAQSAQKINITIDGARLKDFTAAFRQLDPADEDHVTKDGVPEVAALKAVGFETTAEERDAIWGIVEPLLS